MYNFVLAGFEFAYKSFRVVPSCTQLVYHGITHAHTHTSKMESSLCDWWFSTPMPRGYLHHGGTVFNRALETKSLRLLLSLTINADLREAWPIANWPWPERVMTQTCSKPQKCSMLGSAVLVVLQFRVLLHFDERHSSSPGTALVMVPGAQRQGSRRWKCSHAPGTCCFTFRNGCTATLDLSTFKLGTALLDERDEHRTDGKWNGSSHILTVASYYTFNVPVNVHHRCRLLQVTASWILPYTRSVICITKDSVSIRALLATRNIHISFWWTFHRMKRELWQ